MPVTNSIHEIVFAGGSGGNHVRWLLLLHPEVEFEFCPDYRDRVEWITKNVYTRSWNNWLQAEWHLRDKLKYIAITHSPSNFNENEHSQGWIRRNQLYLTFEDKISVAMHYFMVNIGLNNQTFSHMLANLNKWEEDTLWVRRQNLKNKYFLPSDCITQPELDNQWYTTLINHAGYNDCYELANQLQQQYYKSRIQAAKDFIEYFTVGKEFKNHLLFYQTLINNANNVI